MSTLAARSKSGRKRSIRRRLVLAGVLVIILSVAVIVTLSHVSGTTPAPPQVAAAVPPPPQFPNAGNTGVPTGTVLQPSGPLYITTDGAVIDGLDVSGCVTVDADNVTIKNARVRAACSEPIRTSDGQHGLLVRDSEIDGLDKCDEAIGYQQYTVVRVNMHNCSDGPRISGSAHVTIQDSYVHDLSRLPGDHADGTQNYQGDGPVTIRHNTILPGPGGAVNSAVFTADFSRGVFVVDDNLLGYGGYTLRVADGRASITNNRFVRGTWTYGPASVFSAPGQADAGATIVAWSGNRVVDHVDGSGEAEPVPRP